MAECWKAAVRNEIFLQLQKYVDSCLLTYMHIEPTRHVVLFTLMSIQINVQYQCTYLRYKITTSNWCNNLCRPKTNVVKAWWFVFIYKYQTIESKRRSLCNELILQLANRKNINKQQRVATVNILFFSSSGRHWLHGCHTIYYTYCYVTCK